MTIPRSVPDAIADLYHRLATLERMAQNKKRTGRVAEVNAAEGWARVEIGKDADGRPLLTPKIPWMEPAMGGLKFHTPPTVGEQVDVVSETGDLLDAKISSSTPSTTFQRPSDKGDEHVRTVGNARITERDGKVRIEVGATVLEITTDGILVTGRVHIEGDVTHIGNTTQTGIHKDSRGYHK